MKFFLLFFLFCGFFSCGTYEPRQDASLAGRATGSSIDIRDSSFDLSNPRKIILYTLTQDKAEKELLERIAGKLTEKGVEVVLDFGQIVDYGDENYRIRIREKLMSIHQHLQIVAPGLKGNEPIIAEIRAESIPKLIEVLLDLIF